MGRTADARAAFVYGTLIKPAWNKRENRRITDEND